MSSSTLPPSAPSSDFGESFWVSPRSRRAFWLVALVLAVTASLSWVVAAPSSNPVVRRLVDAERAERLVLGYDLPEPRYEPPVHWQWPRLSALAERGLPPMAGDCPPSGVSDAAC